MNPNKSCGRSSRHEYVMPDSVRQALKNAMRDKRAETERVIDIVVERMGEEINRPAPAQDNLGNQARSAEITPAEPDIEIAILLPQMQRVAEAVLTPVG